MLTGHLKSCLGVVVLALAAAALPAQDWPAPDLSAQDESAPGEVVLGTFDVPPPLVEVPVPALPSGTEQDPAAYVLGPADQITVSVLETDEIPAEPIRIGPGGDVHLQLVGKVRAAGLTPGQLEAVLTERLRYYIHEPHVVVGIHEFRSQPVSVIGAVKNPGVHQLEGRKRLIEILSLAGGLREDAGPTVKITRRLEWGPIPLPQAENDWAAQFSVAEVRLEDVMEARNPEQNVLIMPHDVVAVPRADMVYVVGSVIRSGGYVLNERENLSVLQALALAGGLKPTAKQKQARILRTSEGASERTELVVNLKEIMAGRSLDMPLESEDILFVPHSKGKAAARQAARAAVAVGTGITIWRIGR